MDKAVAKTSSNIPSECLVPGVFVQSTTEKERQKKKDITAKGTGHCPGVEWFNDRFSTCSICSKSN